MTWAGAIPLLKRFWPAVPIAVLAIALTVTRTQLADVRHTLSNERSAWTAEIATANAKRADQERGFADRLAEATTLFADRLAARQPLILQSTNTVREYAQTDAGRARCLGADRVRAIDALDAALDAAHPAPAGGGGRAVPVDADPAPGGR